MANLDLTKYGITGTTEIVHNPSYEMLFEEETKPELTGYEKGQVTELGAVNVMTGVYTGRSPKDKYIVVDENSKDTVWWTSDEYKNDNHPMTEQTWSAVKDIAKKELCNKRLFVVDAFCGANKDTRMAIRFIVEVAWQAHFVTNMFIKPTAEELANFEPDFVVYNASKAKVENYKELGLNSETCVAFNITSKEQVIINTWYGGEMKKGMFSMMNYFLPLKGMASMHCSANTDKEGKNTAIFFGLSGTGKTTLSTDPKRLLIGDDEHGWDDNGVFNFEGGCYAKVINLDKDSEPDIYNAIKRNALLENVTVDAEGKIDFADKSVTENTRVSYPINHIQNIGAGSGGGQQEDMVAVALSRGGNTRGGSNGTQEHLHPPVLQGVVGVDGLLCIVGVVLILQVELQAAQSVDLLNGDLRAALRPIPPYVWPGRPLLHVFALVM